MADTPVFGGDAPGVSRIAVAGQTLMAGLLDDVTANNTLDVSSADPTHRVVWTGDGLALVGRDGVLDGQGAGASPRLGAGDADVLATRLTQVAGLIRLERALAQLGQGSRIGGFSLPSSKPGAAFKLQTGETGPQQRCAKPSGPRVDAKGKATASHCDMLQVTLKNPTAGIVDMTVLYIDADSAISMLWPSQNLSNRLESGAKATRAAEAEQADSAGRVIGGEIEDSGAWPSQVALLIAGQPVTPDAQFCGGSMILDTWVLTAAHCIHMADANGVYRDLNPQAISVLIGTNLLAEGQGDAISVEKIIRHPAYVGEDFDNDIALIKLSRAPTVPFKTIQVPDAEFGDQLDTPGVRTVVTGWGLIEGAQRTAEMR
ncbi:MAG: serine protease [Ascidiaceihabitans sp.]|uniref:S1 family serine peptidase n=3 Tax=Alphaproteobacteria TaxID=28211 RepID=UPI00329A3480